MKCPEAPQVPSVDPECPAADNPQNLRLEELRCPQQPKSLKYLISKAPVISEHTDSLRPKP